MILIVTGELLAAKILEKKTYAQTITASNELSTRSSNFNISPPWYSDPVLSEINEFTCTLVIPASIQLHSKKTLTFHGSARTKADARRNAAFKAYNVLKDMGDPGVVESVVVENLGNLASVCNIPATEYVISKEGGEIFCKCFFDGYSFKSVAKHKTDKAAKNSAARLHLKAPKNTASHFAEDLELKHKSSKKTGNVAKVSISTQTKYTVKVSTSTQTEHTARISTSTQTSSQGQTNNKSSRITTTNIVETRPELIRIGTFGLLNSQPEPQQPSRPIRSQPTIDSQASQPVEVKPDAVFENEMNPKRRRIDKAPYSKQLHQKYEYISNALSEIHDSEPYFVAPPQYSFSTDKLGNYYGSVKFGNKVFESVNGYISEELAEQKVAKIALQATKKDEDDILFLLSDDEIEDMSANDVAVVSGWLRMDAFQRTVDSRSFDKGWHFGDVIIRNF
ncbi:hypothetical protein HK098_001929 [Nowakowskiella sp. JEL0407]|nr:hypothetical protein HK098_001929 [Nowakowskiella sp. JEL0407]